MVSITRSCYVNDKLTVAVPFHAGLCRLEMMESVPHLPKRCPALSDLTSAIFCILAVSAGCFQLGRRCGRSASLSRRMASQLVAMLGMLAYMLFLWNRPRLTTLLPSSDLIILGNWLPCWAAFFVGVYLTSPGSGRARKSALSVLTLLLATYSTIAPVIGQPPECGISDSSETLTYQTSPYTCSAACATSLLRLYGIEATEKELTELCLTREGTHWMGVYRGLKLKTANSEWTVVAEEYSEAAINRNVHTPSILALNLDVSAFAEHVDHGFQSDTGHSVVCLGNDGRAGVAVFDPSPDYGSEYWTDSIFRCVRGGVILRLVARDPKNVATLNTQRRVLTALRSRNIAGL